MTRLESTNKNSCFESLSISSKLLFKELLTPPLSNEATCFLNIIALFAVRRIDGKHSIACESSLFFLGIVESVVLILLSQMFNVC